MRNSLKYLALLVTVMSLVAFANAMPIPQENQQESIIEGSLVNLDANARLIILKSAEKEMQFSFDEQTQVIGPHEDGKPVAVRQGSKLKVHYKLDQRTKMPMATRIEVTEP
jgi:hypothetical protein